MTGLITRVANIRRALVLFVALGVAAMSVVGGLGAGTVARGASSQYLMCNWTVEQRTQTVYIDSSIAVVGVSREQVYAAFRPWNELFVKYHGFPIFVETASRAAADVVIDARISQSTWTDTVCNPAYRTLGRSHTTLYQGSWDRERNAATITHELGHALGLADHGADAQHVAGHIGYKPCGRYYGVMSYCTSSQSWFMDIEQPGIYVDGNLVRDYWR